MNAPNRYELFVLEDDEKALEVTEDTKIPNAATFKIVKQDHTVGNMLRAQLLAMPEILFAGYKVPHPLHPYFLIKIQTDGTVTPQAVMEQACTKLIGTISSLEAKFKREFSFKDGEAHSGVAMTGMANEDPYGGGGGAWSGQRDYLDF
ncbi:DNA-directed RNA polymerase [Mycena epipterygia]|nr:DNA-directed RNA polymerase [Mycena epipterygia]